MTTTSPDTVTLPTGELDTLMHRLEAATEAAIDAQRLLAAEDTGWASLTAGNSDAVIDRATVAQVAAVAAVHSVADPLIKRAINLRVAYLGAPDIAAVSPKDGEGQDVNAVVQAFLDDPANAQVIGNHEAAADRERVRETKGNTFHALPTNPRTGRVQIRRIPFVEVQDIVTNPDDALDVWFYKREWTARVVEQGYTGLTRTRVETRRAYYPDINHRPTARPRTIDGIPVQWDTPVVHTPVNRPDGGLWGIPDVLAALPWARGYRDFLTDWARLHKALATVAFRASVKGRRGAAAVRERMPTADTVGGTAVTAEGATFEAVNKSGATIDADSSKPLAGMVAAAMDVPVTMLLSDPGTTGARAVAETLDRPLELVILARRAVDTTFIHAVLGHVVREAVRAPQGPLRGTIRRDDTTGREVVDLAGGQPVSFVVDWPELETASMTDLIEALSKVDGMDVVDPLVVARLVLVALGVDNVDEELAKVSDDQDRFVPPSQALAARDVVAGYDAGVEPR